MTTETLTVIVEELQTGDEFWADKPFKFSDSHGYEDDPNIGDFLYYIIRNTPIDSINASLFFEESSRCVVVPVEYPDGARGSRLFAPGTPLTIRRHHFRGEIRDES